MIQNNSVIVLVMPNIDDDDLSAMLVNLKYKKNVIVATNTEKFESHGAEKLIAEFDYPKKILDIVNEWCGKNKKKIIGIVAFDEEYHYAFSESIARAHNLPFHSRKILDIASNKFLQKSLFKNAGIKTPEFALICDKSDLSDAKYPNVLKIMTGYASLFNFYNKNEKELKQNIGRIRKGHTKELNHLLFLPHKIKEGSKEDKLYSKKQFILEEFVDGTEYSCDYAVMPGGSAKVLRIAKKFKSRNFGYFNGFLLFNPDYEKDSQFKLKDIEQFCTRISKAIGLKSGVCMLDFIFDGKDFIAIETTTRPGVASFIELMDKIYNYTSLGIAIDMIIGTDFDIKIPNETGLVVAFYAKKEGVLKSIDYSEIKRDKKYRLLSVNNYYASGFKIKKVKKQDYFAHLMGYALFKDVPYEKADSLVFEIQGKVYIDVAPFSRT